MFVLTVLEKIKETRLKFSQGSVTVLSKIKNYQEARSKLTNKQLNKLKATSKNKTETILTINKKNFEDKELPHEFFLTTTKIRNVFANNVSTDIKLSRTQISKIIKLGRSFASWLANLGKKALKMLLFF